MLCYLQTIPGFILVPKTLTRPSTEWTTLAKALTSDSLTMVLFVTRKRRWQWSFKYLGVIVDESFSWNSHVSFVASRVYPKLKLLNRISSFLDLTTLLKIYKATILPVLDYGCFLLGTCSKKNSDFLQRLQNKAMRTILRANHLTCSQTMRYKLGLLTLPSSRRFMRFQLVFKIVNNQLCPMRATS